jgi:nitrite reductase/ring-hydroxylating ferredoxin subunit
LEVTVMGVRAAMRSLEGATALEPAAGWLSGKLGTILGNRRLKDILSGSWLGHPLHPVLTDLPIGALGAATLLELLGGEDADAAVDSLTIVGLLSVAPAAMSGASDWVDTVDRERRLGLVHAMANTGASVLYLAALLSRRGGSRGRARLFSLLGAGALSAGGYAGGHLVFARGVGVDHTVFDDPPSEWTRVARDGDVAEETPVAASAGGYQVMLYRRDDEILALADRCTHAGGPLSEGEVDDDLCVTCPWHGSRFRLADGSIVHGPATAPQPSLEARVADGHIEVRNRPA